MQITGEMVTLFLALSGAIAGIWWRVEAKIQAAEEAAEDAKAELARFQLTVAERYASMAHLKDVEVRLVTSIDRLTSQIDAMPDRMLRIIRSEVVGREGPSR